LGPLLGIVGGLLIAAAGGLIVAGRGARRMSSRYEPPRSADTAARPERAGPTAGRTTEGDRSTEDWWRAMDAGSDPTEGPGAGPDSAPGDQ
ncbi:MAG TPA: Trp biosynthesis-associated membrane protein, partial [Nakamurella sp.]|nr:Trp biosynthesis-associated membrane protein [Nakamurella sp.]